MRKRSTIAACPSPGSPGRDWYAVNLSVDVTPMGAPRQTQRDRWGSNKRPVVARYHAYRDLLRLRYRAALRKHKLPDTFLPVALYWRAWMPIPKSPPRREREDRVGKLHLLKPDSDNVVKGIKDALWGNDSSVAIENGVKRWTDGTPVLYLRIEGFVPKAETRKDGS